MNKILFSTLAITILFCDQLNAQSSGQRFYTVENSSVKPVYFTDIEDSISFVQKKTESGPPEEALASITGAIFGIIAGELVPRLVKKFGTWVYKPEKYISEYGSSYQFNRGALTDLANTESIIVCRKGQLLKKKAEEEIASFTFQLDDLKKQNTALPGYRAIALKSYSTKYTSIKLKQSARSMNTVLEIDIIYFDADDQRRQLTLKPIKLQSFSPGAANSNANLPDEKLDYQIIPPMQFIESLAVKVTEVNDRKKDWDKFLEIYNSQEGKISEFILSKLK